MAVGDEFSLKWLQGRMGLGIRPGLTRMQDVLKVLGNPERQLCFAHVAGTNGKGSVSCILAMLLAEDRRVGLFTSPGNNGLRARFEVVGEPLQDVDFNRCAKHVREAELIATPTDLLTEFEALTAMALVYFLLKQVDVVVMEAGLGGRLDSTNVIVPSVSIITNVSFDHQDILGQTLKEIAREKAGIIKSGVPVVTAAQDEPLTEIKQAAKARDCPLFLNNVHFAMTGDAYHKRVQLLSYRGVQTDLYRLKLPLMGTYQRDNTALALAAYESLADAGVVPGLSYERAQNALRKVQHAGRFEVFWLHDVPIVLDGAHNRAGTQALFNSIKDFSELWRIKEQDWLFIIGVLQDKDVSSMIDIMAPLMRDVIICEPNNSRALPTADLARKVQQTSTCRVKNERPRVAQAMTLAMDYKRPVCCFGSLYTVEEARKAMETELGDS